jgi:hypothetical protein
MKIDPSKPRPSEWTPPKRFLDLQHVALDAANENQIYVRARQSGLCARVYGDEGTADRRWTIVIESAAELESVLATIERVRGRHDYNGQWCNAEYCLIGGN